MDFLEALFKTEPTPKSIAKKLIDKFIRLGKACGVANDLILSFAKEGALICMKEVENTCDFEKYTYILKHRFIKEIKKEIKNYE